MDEPRMAEWNLIVLEIFYLLFGQYDPESVVRSTLQQTKVRPFESRQTHINSQTFWKTCCKKIAISNRMLDSRVRDIRGSLATFPFALGCARLYSKSTSLLPVEYVVCDFWH
jgi:hypothetical protein